MRYRIKKRNKEDELRNKEQHKKNKGLDYDWFLVLSQFVVFNFYSAVNSTSTSVVCFLQEVNLED